VFIHQAVLKIAAVIGMGQAVNHRKLDHLVKHDLRPQQILQAQQQFTGVPIFTQEIGSPQLQSQ
jgi:hypothetical protein